MKTKRNQAVKVVREATGMTQSQFAELIGVSKDTVVSWENGRNRLEIGAAYKIHAATGARIQDLIDGRSTVRDEIYGRKYDAAAFAYWKEQVGDFSRSAETMAKAAADEIAILFMAAARPGIGGKNKLRLPAVWMSFIQWVSTAAKDFAVEPQVNDLLREKKIPRAPRWRDFDEWGPSVIHETWDPALMENAKWVRQEIRKRVTGKS